MEREIEKEKGERKNRKRENMRKIEKKRKNYFIQFKSYITKHSTAAEELQKKYNSKYLNFIWQFQAQYYTYAIERPNFTSDKKWAIYLPILGYINVEIAEM